MIKTYDKIISLGSRCLTAQQLSLFKLRNESYPFDWTGCFSDTLPSVIDDDFHKFLDLTNIEFYDVLHYANSNDKVVINKSYPGYGIRFSHRNLKNPDNVKYYQRCISRWKDIVITYNKQKTKLLFVHIARENSWDNIHVMKILQALNKKFKKNSLQSSYDLIVIKVALVDSKLKEGITYPLKKSLHLPKRLVYYSKNLSLIDFNIHIDKSTPDDMYDSIIHDAKHLWTQVFGLYSLKSNQSLQTQVEEKLQQDDVLNEQAIAILNVPDDFDWQCYYLLNTDLNQCGLITEAHAKQHWHTHGMIENRLYKFNIPDDFNWKKYLALNSDLLNAKIFTETEALIHWTSHGGKEGRIYHHTQSKLKFDHNFHLLYLINLININLGHYK